MPVGLLADAPAHRLPSVPGLPGVGNTEACQPKTKSCHRATRRSIAHAKRPELQPLIDHLREVAQGRDDIRAECARTITGSWFVSAARRGEELIAAGLLMLAELVDLDELGRWLRIGWERRRGATVPYGPTS